MKSKPLILVSLALWGLVGCGGPASPAPTVTVTETVTATAEAPEPTTESEVGAESDAEGQTPGAVSPGEAAKNHGVALTVNKAYVSKTIPLNKTTYARGSGYETYTNVKAENGKYLVVETTVENIGKVSMDLTCGYPIAIQAADTRDRLFDPVQELHDYKGNPECNAQLQAGFKEEMTYAFLAPKDAELIGVAFQDTNNEDYQDYAGIRFDKNLK